MNVKPCIAIIGAGPIGLEAALYARLKGYDVTVYERGSVAENIRQWGHVTMFSPFGMNSSEWGRGALVENGQSLPNGGALLRGDEFVDAYLNPLSRLDALQRVVNEQWQVSGIARMGVLKSELIGDPKRGRQPFCLRGANRHHGWSPEADVVLDCSGTFSQPRGWGIGGVRPPFVGVEQGLPEILGKSRRTYAGCHTLVVGGGYSAATNVVALSRLAREEPGTSVTWVTRRHREAPLRRIPDDRLAERDALAVAANHLAMNDSSVVTWRSGYSVRTCDVEQTTKQHLVELDDTTTGETLEPQRFDRIIANVGYQPDRSLYEELQVHECYATQGPMKLASKLLGETSADCLNQTSHGADVLRNPEPNFYILGMKSYGRSSNFLIQIGLQQIVDVFSLIEQDWGLKCVAE